MALLREQLQNMNILFIVIWDGQEQDIIMDITIAAPLIPMSALLHVVLQLPHMVRVIIISIIFR